MAELILTSDGNELARLALGKGETTIGRDTTCDLRIAHKAVSPVHAVVARDRRGFFIRDEGSKWGIVDRGQRVKLKRLRDGDSVTVCKKFKLLLSAPDEVFEDEPSPQAAARGAQALGIEVPREAPHIVTVASSEEGSLPPPQTPRTEAEQRHAEYLAKLMREAAAVGDPDGAAPAADVTATPEAPAVQAAEAEEAPMTARELRERREAEKAKQAQGGLTSRHLMMIALGCVIVSCFSVVAAAFF